MRAQFPVDDLVLEYFHPDQTWHSLESRAMEVTIDRSVAVDGYQCTPNEAGCRVTTTDRMGLTAYGALWDRPLRVVWDGNVLFRGFIRDVRTVIVAVAGRNGQKARTTQISATDALTDWRNMKLVAFSMRQETGEERVKRLLAALGFPTSYIKRGTLAKVMATDPAYSGDPLTVLTDIALCHHARFYCSALNEIKMRTNNAPITVTFSDDPSGSELDMDSCDPGIESDGFVQQVSAQQANPNVDDPDSPPPVYTRVANGTSQPYVQARDYALPLALSELQQWVSELYLDADPPKLARRIETHDWSLLAVEDFELTTMARVKVDGSTFYGAVTGISYTFNEQFLAEIDLCNPRLLNYEGFKSDFDGGSPQEPTPPTPDEDSTPDPDEVPGTTLTGNGGRIVVFTADAGAGESTSVQLDGSWAMSWNTPPPQVPGAGTATMSYNAGPVQPGAFYAWYLTLHRTDSDGVDRSTSLATISAGDRITLTGPNGELPGSVTTPPDVSSSTVVSLNLMVTPGIVGPIDLGNPVTISRRVVDPRITPNDAGTVNFSSAFGWAYGSSPVHITAGPSTSSVDRVRITAVSVGTPVGPWARGTILASTDHGATWTQIGNFDLTDTNPLSHDFGPGAELGYQESVNKVKIEADSSSGSVVVATFDIDYTATDDGGGGGGGWTQPLITIDQVGTSVASYFDGSANDEFPSVSLFHGDVDNPLPVTVEWNENALYAINTAVSGGTGHDYVFGDLNTPLEVEANEGDVVIVGAFLLAPLAPAILSTGGAAPGWDFGTGHVGSGDADDPSSAIYGAVMPETATYTITIGDMPEAWRLAAYIVRA